MSFERRKIILYSLFALFLCLLVYIIAINTIFSSSKKVDQPKQVTYQTNAFGSKLITKLRGFGTYCFANSSIQCLNNIPDVKDYFSKIEIKNSNREVTTAEFKEIFLDMNVKEELVLENAVKILSNCLKSEEINFNRYSCPLEFTTSLLSQIYRESTNSEEFRNLDIVPMDGGRGNIEDFDYHPLKRLFGIKYSVFGQSVYLYTLSISLNAMEKSKTSKLVNDYLLRKEYEGKLPKVLILRTQCTNEKEVVLTSKELIIEDNILVQGTNYKLSSWIVAPGRASCRHFYAIIRDENNNFIECNDTIIKNYHKKEVEDSIYLVFYERE